MSTQTIPTQQTMSESDVLSHIQDTPELVNAIRDSGNGPHIMEVYWNQLSEEEQRQARARMFDLRFEVEWY